VALEGSEQASALAYSADPILLQLGQKIRMLTPFGAKRELITGNEMHLCTHQVCAHAKHILAQRPKNGRGPPNSPQMQGATTLCKCCTRPYLCLCNTSEGPKVGRDKGNPPPWASRSQKIRSAKHHISLTGQVSRHETARETGLVSSRIKRLLFKQEVVVICQGILLTEYLMEGRMTAQTCVKHELGN
jgi:hypothetical protein